MLQEIQEIENVVSARPLRAESRSGKTAETFSVELCDTAAGFRDLQSEWNHLLDHAVRKSAFLRHEFLFSWWEVYGCRQREASPFILLARDRERRLVGVLPLYREQLSWPALGMYALRFLGTVHEAPEYLDVLVAAGAPINKIVKALLTGLANLRNKYDLLSLFDMTDDAVLLAFLPEWAEAGGSRLQQRPWMICPHLKIAGDFETYLQTLPAKHSANFRRQLRKLKERYAVTLEVASAPAQAEQDFAALCELHHQRWAARHETSAFDNDLSRRFHRRVVQALAPSGAVRIFSLQCNGKTVAALYCLLYDDRLMYYQAGFDVAYENQSVGLILLGMVLQHSHEQGYREFDFLRGEEEYKFRWTKTARATVIGEIALTGRAKIYLNGWRSLRLLKKQVCGFFNNKRQQ